MDKKPRPDNRIQFRAEPNLLDWLADRAERYSCGGSIHLAAENDLLAFREVLDAERQRLRFTVAELNCLADLTKTTVIEPLKSIGSLAHELDDAIRLAREYPDDEEDFPAKWGADADDLLRKLRALSPGGELALLDILNKRHHSGAELSDEGWRSVGAQLRGGRKASAKN